MLVVFWVKKIASTLSVYEWACESLGTFSVLMICAIVLGIGSAVSASTATSSRILRHCID
jgi:hypothetical protein